MNEFIFEQCDVSADLDDCSKNFNRLQTRNEFVFDLQRFPDENPLIDDEPEEISYIISGGDVTISAGGAYTIESGFAGEIYVMTAMRSPLTAPAQVRSLPRRFTRARTRQI